MPWGGGVNNRDMKQQIKVFYGLMCMYLAGAINVLAMWLGHEKVIPVFVAALMGVLTVVLAAIASSAFSDVIELPKK